jgi:triacylglycerol esterase/lipase EstA (alpha/beta hydrolase family)
MSKATTLILDGIWGRPWRWEPLRRQIENVVGPAEIFRYNSTGLCSLRELGLKLVAKIEQLDTPVNLVAHSMGGLVVRAAHRHRPDLPIRKACFMCSPLHGTNTAYLLPFRGVREMRPGSAFLNWLTDADQHWTCPTLCLWCRGDAIIIPNRSSAWSKASREIISNVPAHCWPRWSTGLQKQVIEFLTHP